MKITKFGLCLIFVSEACIIILACLIKCHRRSVPYQVLGILQTGVLKLIEPTELPPSKEYVVNIEIGINSRDQLQGLVGCIEDPRTMCTLWLVGKAKQIFENKNNFPSDLSNMRISQHATINILIMTIKPIQLLNPDMPGISPASNLHFAPLPSHLTTCLYTLIYLRTSHISNCKCWPWDWATSCFWIQTLCSRCSE